MNSRPVKTAPAFQNDVDTPGRLDHNGLMAQPYVTWHRTAYVVNLPDFLGLPAKTFAATGRTPAEALDAACEYRDAKLPTSHRVRVRQRELSGDKRRGQPALRGVTSRVRMSFGRPGITLVPASGTASALICATARDHANEQTKTRRFSVNRYGFETALGHALRTRLLWERTIYGHISRLSEQDWLRFMVFAYGQFGATPFVLRDLKHRGSVRDHRNGWLTATMDARKQTRSQGFNVREYGSKHEAWVAAILCCLNWSDELSPHYRRTNTQASSRNATTGVNGVCRQRINDGRGATALIAYEALVYIDGKRRPKRFSAGREHRITAMHDLAAFRAAVAYRHAYERALDACEPFDDQLFSEWKVQFGHPSAQETDSA